MIRMKIEDRTAQLTQYISELTTILKREVRSFAAVLELLVLEEKCLVKSDTTGLHDVLERQGDVMSSIACLEKSRIELLDKMVNITGERREDLNVSRLADMVNNPLRRELIETSDILNGIYEDVNRKKKTNNMLIKQAMLMVETDIRLILGSINSKDRCDVVYAPKSAHNTPAAGVCIDQRL